MRISTSMMYKNFSKALNDKYESINKYSNKIASERSFDRASDDPVAAMHTIKSCHSYTLNKQYQNNLSQASSWVSASETAVREINDILTSVQEKATEAANGTNNSADSLNYSTAMKNYRSEIVTSLNTKFNEQYIFGSNATGATPFQLSDDGKLQVYDYDNVLGGGSKYVDVSSLTSDDVKKLNSALTITVDLGLDDDFEISTSGLDSIISCYDSNTGKATTIVDQLSQAINTCSCEGYNNLITYVDGAQNAITTSEVNIGEKSNMLNQIKTVLIDRNTNIVSSLSDSMGVDSTETIMKYNIAETVYNESLSMASTVLQNSLIDFLN